MGCNMNNEGWIYIAESKHNKKHIKIGSSKGQTPKQRLKDYKQYGGLKIILACKYNDFSNIEAALHIYFGDFFDTSVDGDEWFDFSKKSNQEFIYRISPFLLASSIDVYKDTSFDYSDEFWEKFDNWLKEHSNDDCREYKSFLKNKNYTDYRKFVLSKSTKQTTNQNKVCKYETKFDSIGRPDIDWNLFFKDHKKLVGKEVYPSSQPNNVAKLAKLETPIKGGNKIHNYGILYKNEKMSFGDFTAKTIKPGLNPYDYILFCDNDKTIKDKTIKQVYNELKFK